MRVNRKGITVAFRYYFEFRDNEDMAQGNFQVETNAVLQTSVELDYSAFYIHLAEHSGVKNGSLGP